MPLFTAAQLGHFLQQDVAEATAAEVEKVVWGWLQPALGLAERPAEPSAQVYAWALELGAIAHENPANLDDSQLGEWSAGYKLSAERRKEILDEARASTGTTTGTSPRGSFPPPQPWPDPICW